MSQVRGNGIISGSDTRAAENRGVDGAECLEHLVVLICDQLFCLWLNQPFLSELFTPFQFSLYCCLNVNFGECKHCGTFS